MFYCVGFLKYHQTANTVTLNKSENAVGNIITLLHSFRRSEDAYRAACENLKAWHQTVCYVSHCQSVLSWQAILLDAVPSAFRLRSLRRGRGGLSFAWPLFSCRFASVGITSFQKAFHLYGQNETFRGEFINNSLLNLRFAQMSYSIFAQYNESHINPLHLSPLGEGKNEP